MNKIVDMIKSNDVEAFRGSISSEYKHKSFTTSLLAKEYIKRIDMRELLKLPKSHRCVFHDDKRASASIYQTKNGVYRYKCFSPICRANSSLDIIGVVSALQDCDYNNAFDYLTNALDITYKYDDGQSFLSQCSDIIGKNRAFLDYCKTNKSQALKIIGTNINVLYALYDIAKKQDFAKFKLQKLIIGASAAEIQAEIKRQIKVARALAILAYFGLIRRVPPYEIATKRMDMLIRLKNLHSLNRIISQTEIIRFEPNDEAAFAKLEQRAGEWLAKGYITRTFSFDTVRAKNSIFEANRLFPNK